MNDEYQESTDEISEEAGLPGLRSWGAVYVLVISLFVFYVLFLAAWSRWFA